MSLEGQQIHGYRILRLLGSGGIGDVYLAEDASNEQQVAIKVIRAETNSSPDNQASQEAARLFQDEASAIVKLDHPHILPLYDYGEERLDNTTVIYLVMPYRQEGSLADWLDLQGQAGQLPPQDIAYIMQQAASALQYAHDRQIIHQDVKPTNFLIHSSGEDSTRLNLLLTDFGVAKLASATSSMSHTVPGNPTYIAPEQWNGESVPATDQYALAIMAYELLAGRPPFRGQPLRLMHLHSTTPPRPPSTFNPRLSPEVDMVILHALAKQPQERFPSIIDFANAFQQALQTQTPEGADAPTFISMAPTSTPAMASSGDLHVVLAITSAEAQKGTTRTLTLPGGRQVRVNVPAGTHAGQVVRLEGQDVTSPVGGPGGALILNILVNQVDEPSPMSTKNATVAEETVLTDPPTLPAGTPLMSNPTLSEMTIQSDSLVEPTLEALPASPATSLPTRFDITATELALPIQPTIGQPAEIIPSTQDAQQADVMPSDVSRQASTPVAASQSRNMLFTYRGHSDGVCAVAWSPDGTRIASASIDGTVQVWDAVGGDSVAANGGTAFTYRGHSDGVCAVAWSPDGTRIASASIDGTVQVWDAVGSNSEAANVFTYRGHTFGVNAVAWSPDGKHVASGDHSGGIVQVWDAVTGTNLLIYRGHVGWWGNKTSKFVNAVAWSPDSSLIASAGSKKPIQIWQALTGKKLLTYDGHSALVKAVAWNPVDSQRIASASLDGTVQVWNAFTGKKLFTYRGHSGAVNAVAWSSDGRRIASGGVDRTVQVWDAVGGNSVADDCSDVFTYNGHSDAVLALTWSPDGKRIASGSADKTVQVWVASL